MRRKKKKPIMDNSAMKIMYNVCMDQISKIMTDEVKKIWINPDEHTNFGNEVATFKTNMNEENKQSENSTVRTETGKLPIEGSIYPAISGESNKGYWNIVADTNFYQFGESKQ